MTNVEHYFAENRSLRDRDKTQKAEIEKLRAALKPFADANVEAYQRNDDRFSIGMQGTTLGDFRRAHDVFYPPSVK